MYTSPIAVMSRTSLIGRFLFFLYLLAQFVSLSQTKPTRDDILQDIRHIAIRHAESGAGKDAKYVLDIWETNTAGVTRQEILRTYDEEFTKAKQDHDRSDWIPKVGWIVAFFLFLGIIFLERLKEALGKLIDFAGEKLFAFFAGLPWFYRLALNRYCNRMIERHAKFKIPFRPDRPLDLSTVFVPLKVADALQSSETVDAYTALARNPKLVVTGSPGSGKSILLRHIALTFARRRQSPLYRDYVPILVELNRLNSPSASLRAELARELATKGFPKPDYFLMRGLKRGTLLLLLDGLDEISGPQRPGVLQQIRDLEEEFHGVRLIVSCRTQVYNGELDTLVDKTLEIQSFTDQQIRSFLRSWAPDMHLHGKSVDQLMKALLERPAIMLLARNPLMLTIVAWLYTDTTVILPQSRSEFYRKATELLLYDWKPEANLFQSVPKQLVLRDLALYFQDSADQRQQDRRSVDVRTVLQRIGGVLPSLNIDSAESAVPLLNEIVQRSGLLLAIDGGERYQFAHLTLQEYFAAAALRSDPSGLIERFKQDRDAWREPVKLWCGLDQDATEFIQAIHAIDPLTGFECLADAQKIKSEVANQIIDSMKHLVLSDKGDPTVARAFGSVASSLSDRGRAVFTWLSGQDAPQALEALSYTNMPQAARVLSSFYTQNPIVRPLLCKLGELAVPDLLALAASGERSAIDDLMAIGTPGAAQALTHLLWHDSTEIAGRSAFAIAALFQSPEVFAALREMQLNRSQEAPWVWQPFETDGLTTISVIAGRVVWLLQDVHGFDNLPNVVLDSRLVLPTCAQMGSDLTVSQAPKNARKLSIVELYHKIVGQQSVSSGREEMLGQPSLETLRIITEALFERLQPSERWRFLFRRLSLPVQAELVRGISSARFPNKEDWISIFRPVSYTANRGWHLWLMFALAHLVAVGDMVYLLGFHRPLTPRVISATLILLLGMAVHGLIMFMEEDPLEMIAILELGPYLFILAVRRSPLRDLFQPDAKSVLGKLAWNFSILVFVAVMLTWLSVWTITSFLTLSQVLGNLATGAAIVLLLGSMSLLWFRARSLHRRARNPLSGLRRFLIEMRAAANKAGNASGRIANRDGSVADW